MPKPVRGLPEKYYNVFLCWFKESFITFVLDEEASVFTGFHVALDPAHGAAR